MMTTKHETPTHTDEFDDEHHDTSHEHDEQTSPDGEGNGQNGDNKSSLPMQKRRRVTRACDTCRGKKIKCDGKQPCTHCTVYSYECTYDQPSNRRRNPAPQYIEALESRLARAEALLKTVMPQADLNDPNLGNGSLPPIVQFPHQMPRRGGPGNTNPEDKDSMMESMIEDTGALDLDDQGRSDYYGSSSGRVFYERISRQMGAYSHAWWSDVNQTENFLRDKKRNFDSPRSAETPIDQDGLPNTQDLPNKECAQALCEVALDDAMCLLRFMHHPTFWGMFNRIYDTDPSVWTTEEHKYLPVVYACMALGTLFAKTEDSKLEVEGYQASIENGFIYFKAAIQMIDMTDIRELCHLQAVLLLTYFIQCSAKLNTCYSFVGVCLFGALRMGMHRNYPGRFNCLEDQMRKRTFWLVRKMDIYVGGILGMPILLSDDDIDQEYPAEVDDEFILPDKILPQPEGTFPAFAGANYHNQLLGILSKILKYVYPLNPRARGEHGNSVSYAKIREVEKDLDEWLETLPIALQPGAGGNLQMVRVQQMLRMSYAHVQMTLYRPFLHYMQAGHKGNVDRRFYAAAASCVAVSRNVIHIMSEMNRRHLLIGAYWFQMYSTFWAVLTLVYYAVENQDNPTAQPVAYYNDALDGRDMLATMAKRSNAADRCNFVLQELFSKLPPRWNRGRDQQHIPLPGQQMRKRQAQSQPNTEDIQAINRPQSNPRAQPRAMANGPHRSSTMPHHQHSSSLHTPGKRISMNNIQFSGPANPAAALVDAYGRPTHGLYTPPGSTEQLTQASASPDHPSSPSSATFGPGVMNPQNYGAAPAFNLQPPVPDLANVMFPSNDPFAYPAQPMATFENHFGPIESMNGGFDMTNGDSNPMGRAHPQTIGDWMATSQAGTQGEYKQPIGPTAPADFGMGDWIRTTAPPQHQAQHQHPQHQQDMQHAPGDGITYESIFAGQDQALDGMGVPTWFNGNGLV